MTSDLEFVGATEADSDRLSDIIVGDLDLVTTQVALKVVGIISPSKERRLWRIVNRREEVWRHVMLAKSGGETVGVLMTAPIETSSGFTLLL